MLSYKSAPLFDFSFCSNPNLPVKFEDPWSLDGHGERPHRRAFGRRRL